MRPSVSNWLFTVLIGHVLASVQDDLSSKPWRRYIQSPPSRIIRPKSIHAIEGNVVRPQLVFLSNGSKGAQLNGVNATLSLDFGQMTSGRIGLSLKNAAPDCASVSHLAVAFSESALYVGRESDYSRSLDSADGALNFTAQSCDAFQSVTTTNAQLRGSFRYATLFSLEGDVEVKDVHVEFYAQPDLAINALQEYTGFFYSSDDLLNRIWYAGVYTVQLCTIDAHAGREVAPAFPDNLTGWNNSAPIPTLQAGQAVLIDGAKRDRSVWAGDYNVAAASAFVSTNYQKVDIVKHGLMALFSLQNSTSGLFTYTGPPIPASYISDTYHLWTLAALIDYYRYSGDAEFVQTHWDQFARGLQASLDKISDGLFNVTLAADWGRIGTGGTNAQANMILYKVLRGSTELAAFAGGQDDIARYASLADALQANITAQLWDDTKGAFKDNTTAGAAVYPQDGNSLAVLFDVTGNATRDARISSALKTSWNDFGAVNPESGGAISPFVSSSELQTHFLANDNAAGYELLRRQWGYMLHQFSNSTTVEGYFHDGSLHYPFYGNVDSYISHAHAWSTGPTYSLLSYAVGFRNITAVSNKWSFKPATQGSGLAFAQGGFSLPDIGNYTASWSLSSDGSLLQADFLTPNGTSGTIALEAVGQAGQDDLVMYLDDEVVFQNGTGNATWDDADRRVLLDGVAGGMWHNVLLYNAFTNLSANALEPSPNRTVMNVTESA